MNIAVSALLLAAACAAQTPVITAVLDAGGYTPNIAQGSIFVVKGSSLSRTDYVPAPALPLGTTLDNVKITFTPVAGGQGRDCYMVYTYNLNGTNQLAAILPSGVAPGDYNVTVTNGSAVSAPFRSKVVARKFGIISQDSSGSGNAAVLNTLASGAVEYNRLTTGKIAGISYSPAKPGEAVVLWGTGLGPISTADNAAPPGLIDFRSQADIKVWINGQSISPDIYAGRSPEFPGLDQINVTLPANVATGCTVSLQVSVNGEYSNPVTLAIAPANANACVSPTYSQDTLSRLDEGASLTTGNFAIGAFAVKISALGLTVDAKNEQVVGTFSKYSGAQLAAATAFLNPAGGCQVYHRVGTATALVFGGSATNLDAGAAITLAGPNITSANSKLGRGPDNTYLDSLGTAVSIPGVTLPPGLGFNTSPLITTGTYTLAGTGGANVGPFTASVTLGTPIALTGALPAEITRDQGVTLNWTGGGSTDLVEVIGFSGFVVGNIGDSPVYDGSVFICTTTAGNGSFTVPAAVLQQLPVTPGDATVGLGGLGIVSTPKLAPGSGLFTAPLVAGGNIDTGVFLGAVGFFANPSYK